MSEILNWDKVGVHLVRRWLELAPLTTSGLSGDTCTLQHCAELTLPAEQVLSIFCILIHFISTAITGVGSTINGFKDEETEV